MRCCCPTGACACARPKWKRCVATWKRPINTSALPCGPMMPGGTCCWHGGASTRICRATPRPNWPKALGWIPAIRSSSWSNGDSTWRSIRRWFLPPLAVRELPSEAVREFRERIQPLLLNSCASGQCHGPQTGGSFRLLRPSFGRVASRRLTQRNLYSVVNHIDPDDPAQSPLLRAACTAHGSPERRSVAPAGSRQYEMLADWVRTLVAPPVEQAASAAGKTAPQQGGAVEPAVFETPVSGGDQSSAPQPAAGEFSTGGMQQSAGGVVPAAFDEQTTPSPVDQPPADRTQGIQYGVRLEAFEPARYFPQSPDQSPRAGASGDTTPASELSPQVPSSEHATSQPLQFAGGAVGGTPEDASHSASGGMSEPRSSAVRRSDHLPGRSRRDYTARPRRKTFSRRQTPPPGRRRPTGRHCSNERLVSRPCPRARRAESGRIEPARETGGCFPEGRAKRPSAGPKASGPTPPRPDWA